MKRVHFIGIGGIGVSAIARMMLADGKIVSGSDFSDSDIIRELKNKGAEIYPEHRKKNIKNPDMVVYSPAISGDNPELMEAEKRGIPLFSYPQMLGEISRRKFTIAVSGAHGKTTTTAMIGTLLKDAKLDPTIIVGSLLKGVKSNFVAGQGQHFVVEACEYKKSFLNIDPKIIVITNIDNDHLDYYKTVKNIEKAFGQFAAKLPADGFLVCDPSAPHIKTAIKNAKCGIINYSKMPELKLKVVGGHNVKNAQGAFAVGKLLGIKDAVIRRSLENFSGTWRRFEYKGKAKSGAHVYDDYGHHPTEIKATLKAARGAFPDRKIICVFQPHLYSRTKLLMDDFCGSFGDADSVIVNNIYAAREKDPGDIHARDLVKKMSRRHKNARHADSFAEAAEIAQAEAREGDIILTMGAGDVHNIGGMLL